MIHTTISEKQAKSALAYLGFFVTGIVLLLTQKDKEVRFHALQSTLFFGAFFLIYLMLKIVPFLGWIISILISPTLFLIVFIVWIFLMWKAYNGEKYLLPYFGEIAEKQLTKMK